MIEEWDAYVEELAPILAAPQAAAVRALWAEVRGLGHIVGLPHFDTLNTDGDVDGDVRVSWSRIEGRKMLIVRILPSGLCRWFCGMDPTGLVEGTKGDPEPVPTAAILARLLEFFAPGKGCA